MVFLSSVVHLQWKYAGRDKKVAKAREKNAKPPFLDERLFKTRRLHQVTHRDEN